MSLRRPPTGPSARPARGPYRPEVLRLDDRIVPDAASVTSPAAALPTDPSSVTGQTTTTTPAPITPAAQTIAPAPMVHLTAFGEDAGNPSRVRVYDTNGTKKFDFIAYPNGGFRGGVRVATGDINGDGVDDIVTAPGTSGKPYIQVFDGVSGQQLLGFNAYDPNFKGGAYVAVGDVNGDGRADLVVGAGDSGGSHIKVYNGAQLFPDRFTIADDLGPDSNLITWLFAYDPKVMVGARVAVADVNGDGHADIIVAPGAGGGPDIRVFSGADGTMFREWYAYDALFTGGVYVAAGDLNGDGQAEVITGMGATGNGRVTVYDGKTGRIARSFSAPGAVAIRASVRVGVFDFDHDGHDDLVTGIRNELTGYDGRSFSRLGAMNAFDASHVGAVFFS